AVTPFVEPGRKSPRHSSIAAALGAAALAIAAFFGVRALTSHGGSSQTVANAGAASTGSADAGGGRRFGGGTFGTITDIDGSTITLADQNGTSTKVITTSSTRITKSVTAAVGDIKAGDRVVAMGS